ncbi:hypothetical protein Aspvir_006073 [Aspergillus viridinutans]|uniref:Uncharacterized protein n=1 Tax=Aspergillus viridinutans TaxID=75553 RepID=A0A9P3BSG6_ASPVI|nr:uncharacterized protein Aspvir_006073 [Aspergillus viridinutans]GIK02030.1 hypothetical protein Aspvir_006073 [Aspergillus viridinutans]
MALLRCLYAVTALLVATACAQASPAPCLVSPAPPPTAARRRHPLHPATLPSLPFTGNYIHHASGRSSKLEFNNYWHVYNNYGTTTPATQFDVSRRTNALIEGNVFDSVDVPLQDSSAGAIFAIESSDQSTCRSAMGQTCVGCYSRRVKDI